MCAHSILWDKPNEKPGFDQPLVKNRPIFFLQRVCRDALSHLRLPCQIRHTELEGAARLPRAAPDLARILM